MEHEMFRDLLACELGPSSITIITTYKCTAACKDCCFESNPAIKGKLEFLEIQQYIDECVETFPSLKVAVFSGGEPLLLGHDLFKSIRFASDRGLATRIVSNGYWGKSRRTAESIALKLKRSGLSEINLSTGLDHSQYVSQEALVNAVQALAYAGIPNRITIESDDEQSAFTQRFTQHPVIQDLLETKPDLVSLQINSWMPFHGDSARRQRPSREAVCSPCEQIFSNLVLTPHRELSACCGLTFEHFPNMKLGGQNAISVREAYDSIYLDFLKIWIHVDGPGKILQKLFGESVEGELDQIHHICQACVLLHQSEIAMREIRERYLEFVPDVIARFRATQFLKQRAAVVDGAEAIGEPS